MSCSNPQMWHGWVRVVSKNQPQTLQHFSSMITNLAIRTHMLMGPTVDKNHHDHERTSYYLEVYADVNAPSHWRSWIRYVRTGRCFPINFIS